MADVASSEPAAPPVPKARPGTGRPESKAAGIYLYSRTAASLLILVTLFLAARVYSTAGFGYVQAVLLIYETAISLGSLGLAEAVFYFVGRHPERASAIVRQTSGLLLAASVPVIGAVAIAGYVMSGSAFDLIPALPWLMLLVLFELPTQPVVNQLLAGGHAVAASVLFVGFAILRTAAALAPAVTGWSLDTVPIMMAIFGFGRVIAHVAVLRLYYPMPPGERWLVPRELRAMLAFALPAGFAATAGKLNPQIDKYVVNLVIGASAFAVYSAASWELPLITLIPFAIGAVMQVRYVRLFASGEKQELRRMWEQNVQKTILLVVPLATLAIVVADDLIYFVLSGKYPDAAAPFRIFTILLFHRIAAYGPMLQAIGKTRLLMVTSGLMVMTNLILTVPMTYLLGSNGAAIATVLSALPPWSVSLYFIGKAWGRGVRDALPWRFYLAVLALAAGVGVAIWFGVGSLHLDRGARLAVGSLAYLGLYAGLGRLVGLIQADDLAFLRRWLSFGLVK